MRNYFKADPNISLMNHLSLLAEELDTESADSDFEEPDITDIGLHYWQGKWKIAVYDCLLKNGTMRYGSIYRKMSEHCISYHSLTKTLREMEKDMLLMRTDYNEIPPRVEYTLTESARNWFPVMIDFLIWTKKHREFLSR